MGGATKRERHGQRLKEKCKGNEKGSGRRGMFFLTRSLGCPDFSFAVNRSLVLRALLFLSDVGLMILATL